MVLETTFVTSRGKVRLIDCLSVEEGAARGLPAEVPDVIPRLVWGIEGEVEMEMVFRPRFDYGNVIPWIRSIDGVIEAVGGPDAIDLHSGIPVEVSVTEREGTARWTIEAGQEVSFVASHRASHEAVDPLGDSFDCKDLIDRTDRFWSGWANRCTYEGRWSEEVRRSLITLKALTHSPTGGIVAAPTTSLPEHIGGARNWDYRYCWIRDSTFMLDLLLEFGFKDEAVAWRDWLLRAVAGHPKDLQIMYGIGGERRLVELELGWLEGYEGSAPVRTGNGAVEQFQLDVYGEVLDSFHSARRAGVEEAEPGWALQTEIIDFVCENWQEPDEGIWEVRSGREHFVHSKVMAWVAVDRGIKAIERFGNDGPLDQWKATRDAIRADVMAKGIDATKGCFTRAYGDSEMDAALLVLPLVGFIDADDPVMRSTIEHVEDELMSDGLLLRYRTSEVTDGLPSGEGRFLLCSFWLVDCFVLLDRRKDAEKLFERLVALTNDLGLLSEQYDPVAKRFLGNFPQAFSHVALVTSAVTLQTEGRALGVRRGE